MDLFKHFSHIHGLSFHQIPRGSEIHCSGCKSPASGNVYVCGQCNYYLHEQCYRATRSLNHLSHHLHPLTLAPYPTYPSGSFFCNSCNLVGHGSSYTCAECEFDMHVLCALSPNSNPQGSTYPPTPNHIFASLSIGTGGSNNHNNSFPSPYPQPHTPPPNYSPPVSRGPPTQPPTYTSTTNQPPPLSSSYPIPSDQPRQTKSLIKHFSHPHVLKQMEPDQRTGNLCSACECYLSSSAAYCCAEPQCTFNLHKACFDSPLEIRHKFHLSHPLKLVTTPRYSSNEFTCDACRMNGKAFAYSCATCSADLHIDCAFSMEKVTRPDHEHSLTLYYSFSAAQISEEGGFICDACNSPVDKLAWIYYCRDCDFGTHVECGASDGKKERASSYGESELEATALSIRIQEETQQAILELWDDDYKYKKTYKYY